MAGVKSFSKEKAKAVTLDERMTAWARRKQSTGVSWRDVSALSLRCALTAVLAEGAALMFAPAAGGKGVMLKLYMDGQSQPEFAMTAEEVNQLLEGLCDAFTSGSEDLRESLAGGAE